MYYLFPVTFDIYLYFYRLKQVKCILILALILLVLSDDIW